VDTPQPQDPDHGADDRLEVDEAVGTMVRDKAESRLTRAFRKVAVGRTHHQSQRRADDDQRRGRSGRATQL